MCRWTWRLISRRTRCSTAIWFELQDRLGLTVIVKNDAFRLVPQALAAGRVVALIADQNIRKRGVFVDFFGKAAATAKGPALFALRTGAPVFLGVAVRKQGYPSRYRVIIEPVSGGGGSPWCGRDP